MHGMKTREYMTLGNYMEIGTANFTFFVYAHSIRSNFWFKNIYIYTVHKMYMHMYAHMHAYLYLCWHSLFDGAILLSISNDMFVFFANIPINGASVSVHLVTVFRMSPQDLTNTVWALTTMRWWPGKNRLVHVRFFFFGGGGEGCCLPESLFF